MSEIKQSYQEEIKKLKESLGGYKTANANYRRQVEALRKTIAERNEELMKIEDERNGVIENLRTNLSSAKTEIVFLKEQILTLTEERDEAQINLKHYLSLPWYKRISVK